MARQWQSSLLLALVVLLAPATVASDAHSHGEALIEWLRSKDGYFSQKLEIRRANPKDSSSTLGVFAKEQIQEKELLLAIPPNCFITAGAPVEYPDWMECDTVRNLIKEMKLGDDSEYAPYVNYLLSQNPGQLPSAWSEAGKDLLLEVLTDSTGDQVLPPGGAVGWIENAWYDECDGTDDPFEENAALLVVQRAWDDLLVPLLDMINHRNGHWLNTENNAPSYGATVEVQASRDIDAGEEIYTTYNLCEDCVDDVSLYGTAEILRDFGFVENYPQCWIFHHQGVAFEIDEEVNDDGTATGELEITWIGDEPSGEAVSFLQAQLQRLEDLAEAELESPDETVPKNEWDVIWQYHQALRVVMTHAIVAALDEDEEEMSYLPA